MGANTIRSETTCYPANALNNAATQFHSSEFFIRRLDEHERTLNVLTVRIEESYTTARHPKRATKSLLVTSASQSIVSVTRKGEVGRPRLQLAQEQLESAESFPFCGGFPRLVLVFLLEEYSCSFDENYSQNTQRVPLRIPE